MLARGAGVEARLKPVPWWVRVVLLIAAAQALLLLAALVDPVQVKLLVPWPASPLNARFIAALYVSLGAGVAAAAFARTFVEVRIVLVGIGIATVLLLALTFLRMATHPGELETFPLFWVVFYIIDPLLVAAVFWRLGWGEQKTSPSRRPPATWLWLGQAAVFGIAGLALLVAPDVARSLWPWAMTEPQAQIYSAFFLTLSATGVLAFRETRWEGVRIVVAMVVLLSLLVMVVSAIHLPRFTRPGATATWFTVFAVEALAFGALFVTRTLRRT